MDTLVGTGIISSLDLPEAVAAVAHWCDWPNRKNLRKSIEKKCIGSLWILKSSFNLLHLYLVPALLHQNDVQPFLRLSSWEEGIFGLVQKYLPVIMKGRSYENLIILSCILTNNHMHISKSWWERKSVL